MGGWNVDEERYKFIQLTESVVERYIDGLVRLEKETVEELGSAFDDFPWGEKEFRCTLLGKWEYSLCAIEPNQDVAIGFLIVAQWENNLHGHRMIVDKRHRKYGTAWKFYEILFRKAKANGIENYTAQVPYSNLYTKRWYQTHGFELLNTEEDLVWYTKSRDPTARLFEDHILSDDGHKSWVLRFKL